MNVIAKTALTQGDRDDWEWELLLPGPSGGHTCTWVLGSDLTCLPCRSPAVGASLCVLTGRLFASTLPLELSPQMRPCPSVHDSSPLPWSSCVHPNNYVNNDIPKFYLAFLLGKR